MQKFPPEQFKVGSMHSHLRVRRSGGFMYAVIRTGGKQYRVAPGDVVKIESVSPEQQTSSLQMFWRFTAKQAAWPSPPAPR